MKVEITIYNVKCIIKNTTSELDAIIADELAYLDATKNYAFYNTRNKVNRLEGTLKLKLSKENREQIQKDIRRQRFLLNKLDQERWVDLYVDGEFPTGLLPRLTSLLEEERIEYELIDKRVKPKKQYKFITHTSFPPLRYYQKRAVKAAVEEGRGVIVAATGTGKSLVLMKLIWELGVKCIIITPNKNINDMMYENLVKYFGKGKVARLNTKSVKTKEINLCNIQSLIKINPTVLKDVSACFNDEFHHSVASSYVEVNEKHLANCYFRIGLTATNFRNDNSDLALEGVLSNVLDTYSTQQGIKDGYLAPPKFEIIENSVSATGKYQTQYKKGIVLNDERNNLIADIVCDYPNRHILVLVKEIEHGEILFDLISQDLDSKELVFLNGKEKDVIRQQVLKDYKSGKIRVMIATGVMGEGVDVPIADMLIMAASGKSKIQVIQNIGRVLRPYPNKKEALIFDFTDTGAEYLERHALMRQEVYNSYEV